MAKVKVGIVGGTGYTGVELLRILASHPEAEVTMITSRSEEGVYVADMYPNLRGIYNLAFSLPEVSRLSTCDIVFFATPHGVAMSMAQALIDAGVKVIDLAADFRIEDLTIWQKWYGIEPATKALMAEAVYGLPEYYREQIKAAKLIANPGCYPTSILLGLLPLLQAGLVKIDNIIADGKSGVSGAGKGAKVAMLGAEMSESFKAYGVAGHRHLPEIKEKMAQLMDETLGQDVGLTFVPHLVPMIRGMESTIYATLTEDKRQAELQAIYESAYENEAFVDVMPSVSLPETRMVKGSNMCRLSIFRPEGSSQVVITSVIDNLVKGAAGQAVQNMNLMCELPENTGLTQVALLP